MILLRALLLALLLALPLPFAPALADGLTYLVHAPAEASPHPPLIVLMHGSGADERDMITLWRDLPPTFVVISPRAPFPHGGGYIWYRKDGATPRASDLTLSTKIIDLVIDSAVQRFDVDPKRIFIGGFSQGGVMTYQIALHEPGRFRGAAVLSGLLFPAALAGAKTGPSFFIAHGTTDTRIPFATSTSARDTLAKRGMTVAFHAYQGMGHGTGAEETRDLNAWLQHELAAP